MIKIFQVIAILFIAGVASQNTEDPMKIRDLEIKGDDLTILVKDVPETNEPEQPEGLHDGGDDDMLAEKAELIAGLYMDERNMTLDELVDRFLLFLLFFFNKNLV